MALTPMMKQYMETKRQYSDCILFYRLGDFYEMFYEDAIECSRELEIALTGKDCGLEDKAPMCGVPHHSVDTYLMRLVKKGYKVAICEQLEDAKATRGIVKRDVIRIVTPGTNINTNCLDETKNNYLMCVFFDKKEYGISIADITTGDYFVTQVNSEKDFLDEVNKFEPSEIICNDIIYNNETLINNIKTRLDVYIYELEKSYFNLEDCSKNLKIHFKVDALEGLGLEKNKLQVIAAGAILKYISETQKSELQHITKIKPYITGKYMIIDGQTRRNLELLETLREKNKKGSLLWVLDKTKTAMGARLLRNYIEQPLIDIDDINMRLDATLEFNQNIIDREEIRDVLSKIYDLERLVSKITYKTVNARDLNAFKNSLKMLPELKRLLAGFKSELLSDLYEKFDVLEDIFNLIDCTIIDDPPLSIKDGGIIKQGYNKEVDKYKTAKTEGTTWISQLEEKEKKNTGIKNLRIKYNKVFGYYLEVTNSYKNLVPDNWIRKQTLANAERYCTEELKKLEDIILEADEKLAELEYNIFDDIRRQICEQVIRIQNTAKAVAIIDVFASFGLIAERENYVRPKININGIIDIKDGRHPVIEKMIDENSFVTNDTFLDNKDNKISIITGPNMAGKSTYMRQTALIVLMAHIGCFVPASQANIGIVDRIFTRVGASDDLASGQSTFMVEMTEVANILRNATNKSLLILDEIGRGTSTFDGLSIAWAVVEYISCKVKAKTLFATHYHELTELEGRLESVNNYCIAVKENGDDILFLRKIVKGGADKSYGIHVARLAGVPEEVLKRANEIANDLNDNDIVEKTKNISNQTNNEFKKIDNDEIKSIDINNQIEIKNDSNVYEPIIDKIKNIDINNMTPRMAMNFIYELQEICKK